MNLYMVPQTSRITHPCASPFSRGNVTIASNDTSVHPVINLIGSQTRETRRSPLQASNAHMRCSKAVP